MKKNLTKCSVAIACATLMVANMQATATTINLATDGVGYFTPTVIPPPTLTDTYLNNMITVYNSGTSSSVSSEFYQIEKGSATPNPLSSSSALSVNNGVGGSPLSYTFTLPTGTKYLIAQWDGPNGVDAVYYVGGLSGSVTIVNDVPGVSPGNGQNYSAFGLSDLWFGDSTPSVPDSGTTVLLLGAAMTGLGLIRRKLS